MTIYFIRAVDCGRIKIGYTGAVLSHYTPFAEWKQGEYSGLRYGQEVAA